ncbi:MULTISPECIES: hypothetical protein [unclassified Methylobacterium]|uniref:hypothetical protein n=1 Tax=unclassified Methylobacterium TaxID=2615210 RepID=UPI000CC5537E|nr:MULTISPECIES: hypothetical protein [unclassified Methylobacterium]PIU06639.1 MAG: hypothetical protein COT56_08380 [Methylobacterium sp. CG09_land_8_20_14_0_10_71_15]PIU12101.1 MAG: hypothetical protein COT28_16865 [Methylobacterium sp. CG08_land_8_20_14_0_20_71_15]GBU19681.1 hypothetical protein AwMethylo_38960 [Methylobacterium sp.]
MPAATPHFIVPVSRNLAASLSVVDGPMTSLDLALWLGLVCHALTLEDEPDADGGTLRDEWILSDEAVVWAHGRTLLAATGMRAYSQLERPFERLAATTVSIGRRGRGHRLWKGWEASPVDRETPTEVGIVSGAVLAWGSIHGQPWTVPVNLSALARFRSRFSAIVYLRALAWLAGAGTPSTWKRTPPGDDVTVTIPVQDLPRALGTAQLDGMREWDAKALGTAGRGGPVQEDLETAGIRMVTQWVMAGAGRRQVPVALRIRVSRGAVAAPKGRRQRQAPASALTSSPSDESVTTLGV